jgi:hypothetical protein
VFIDEGICSAAAVEFDPDEGCKTYSPAEGVSEEDDWDEDEESEEWEDDDLEDEEDDWDEDEDEI